jgi:DNA-binding transcriptional LysR family regulator
MDSAYVMRAFVQIVDRASFSSAAEDLGITPSAISKLITRLEDRLGVRLLHRTTRRLSLTPEGETYYQRARDILAAIADAEAEVSRAGQIPRGRLRVNCITAFALHQLVPALPEFNTRFPDVTVELSVSDRMVDLLAENADIGIRTGDVSDPSLVARKFAEIERGLYASPDYLALRGVPESPQQLSSHDCIVLTSFPSPNVWMFRDDDMIVDVKVAGRFVVDTGEASLKLAIAGGGIARLGEIIVAEAVREGRLVPVLRHCYAAERAPISAVYPQGRHRMPKVRAFIDFLVERFARAPWRRTITESVAHTASARTATAAGTGATLLSVREG